jgi:predicted RNase H-like HicB family nuclease
MKVYKVPLRLEPQPEGGYTVTSPALRGLVTEGETVAELESRLIDEPMEVSSTACRANPSTYRSP